MTRVQAARRTRRKRRAGDELRAAILRAASEVFLKAGYQGASLEAVIARVGGSKRAIYSHFGSKKALFAALVREASNRAVEPLAADDAETQDLEDMLQAFGMQVTRVLMSPTTMALYRVVMAESARFPDVAREFFDNGPGRASASLARALSRLKRAGRIDVDDSRRAAERFIGMLRDDLHLRVVLGLRPPPTERELKRSVRQAVSIFLGGVERRARTPGARARTARPQAKAR